MPHYGFNFLWMFSADRGPAADADEAALDFLATTGFNFVRIPTDYRYWVRNVAYFEPDEAVFAQLDRYLAACRSRGLHMSLNLHRAPGYCINRNDLERHNLWLDQIAQDAFVFQWETFARRYQGVPAAALSFDLLNEPPAIGQYGLTRANHAALMQRTAAAIRVIDPTRPLVVNGLGAGHLAMPELADLGATHSGRGYQPMPISHYRARWWDGHATAPAPAYPGLEWQGQTWNRAALQAFYEPWHAVAASGVAVHIGEFGCFEHTPNAVALRWLGDLLGVFRTAGWGYALWEFAGPFGIVGHRRAGARFEQHHGWLVDRDLLELLLANQVNQAV